MITCLKGYIETNRDVFLGLMYKGLQRNCLLKWWHCPHPFRLVCQPCAGVIYKERIVLDVMVRDDSFRNRNFQPFLSLLTETASHLKFAFQPPFDGVHMGMWPNSGQWFWRESILGVGFPNKKYPLQLKRHAQYITAFWTYLYEDIIHGDAPAISPP